VTTLLVAEVFGPTFQGEGASLGQRAAFVRLGRCNLDCGRGAGATWACDTPYTWDWERYDPAVELSALSVAEVVGRVEAMGVDRVVVTGGEPLVQQRKLVPFLAAARDRGWAVEVETNGTIAPLPEVVALVERFNVSPKTANSGVPASKALRPRALEALRDSGRAMFKFVVASPEELDDVAAVVDTYRLSPVIVMPAGTTADDVLDRGRKLADPVLARGWHLTTRLHVLLWGDERCR
jgi:7-carboxy-7-deazaguanine synthase